MYNSVDEDLWGQWTSLFFPHVQVHVYFLEKYVKSQKWENSSYLSGLFNLLIFHVQMWKYK